MSNFFSLKKQYFASDTEPKDLVLLTQLLSPPAVFRCELLESKRAKNPAKPGLKSSEKKTITQSILHNT